MSKIYYIDSENVGDSWIDLIDNIECKILVFYTINSPKISYSKVIQLLNSNNKAEFIACHTGTNALDFQLSSYLGYELNRDSSNEMIIVSNDAGFDAVVHFWKERNMNIKRSNVAHLLKSVSSSTDTEINETSLPLENPILDTTTLTSINIKNPTSDDEVDSSDSSGTNKKTIHGIDQDEIEVIVSCIGIDNKGPINNTLKHFYGSIKGTAIYNHLKKSKFDISIRDLNKKERFTELLRLIKKYNPAISITYPSNLDNYLYSHISPERKTMSKRLIEEYGQDGQQLSRVFKPYYKVLSKIKK